MADEDTPVTSANVYYVFTLFAILGVSWYFRKSLRYHVQKRMFAWFMNNINDTMNRALHDYKTKAFERVHQYSDDGKKELTVLEVGAGTVANIAFFPPNCRLTCLEPNPHFKDYIKKNLEKCEAVISVDIVQGVAEQMPFESDQFDVVVCTIVLCSVPDIEGALAEIKRVLKPGGLFVFVEHVAAAKNTWTWFLQCIANPFHHILIDGCDVKRETGTLIQKAGFKNLSLEAMQQKRLPLWIRLWIMGTASK